MQNTTILGDWQDYPPPTDTSLILADPVYDSPQVNQIIETAIAREIPAIVFCSVSELYRLEYIPDQTGFWVKPVST